MECLCAWGVFTVAYHIDLADPCPEFIRLLDVDRDAALAGFQRFAMQMFQESPPPYYALVRVDDREDVFSDVILHCIRNDCAKLRLFQPGDNATFRGWFATVAMNKILDYLRKERSRKSETGLLNKEDPPSPEKSPEQRALERDRQGIFFSALRRMERRCRLLLRLSYRGFKNREIVQLMHLPKGENKKIGNQMVECRDKLKRLVREAGFFDTGRTEAG